MVLGARSYGYVSYWGCSPGDVGLHPGTLTTICDQAHCWSLHSGWANFLLADGSARFVSYNADAILPQLATRAGGEVVPEY